MRLLRVSQLAGQYADAEALCDDLIRDAQECDLPSLSLTAACIRLEVRALRGESIVTTLESAGELLVKARDAGALREVVALLTMISDLYAQRAEWTEAQRLAREAWTVAATLSEPELHGDTAIRLGTALLDTSPAEALEHFRSAARIYETSGSRHGQTRCLVNCGIAWSRLGDPAAAELAYREAAAMAESARLVDLGGLVALNLAVLLTRAGRYDAADEQYDLAMHSFRRVKNEPRRLATLYNQAHHAREQGDPAKAYDLSLAAAELALELGSRGIHDGSLASAGIAALALGKWTEVDVIKSRLTSPGRTAGTWSPGREIVEAFLIRYALAKGDADTAMQLFKGATVAAQGDPYASAWLVAECAPLVRPNGELAVRESLRRALIEARRHGYEPLARRISAAVRIASPTDAVPSLDQR